MRMVKGRRDKSSIKAHQEAAQQLEEVYIKQEIFWKQRSKQFWLREGDQNSKYFHAATKVRRKINYISSLEDENGQTVGWENGLQQVMVDYFNELFSATDTNCESIIDCVTRCVTVSQNEFLLNDIEKGEVKSALFSMHPHKSPGPDGMSPGFYQRYWHIVGEDVFQFVKRFFETGKFDDKSTDTNIVLIPKKPNPKRMADLRPISLCNVLYKVASKVMANRFKQILNGMISESQSAFVPGRLITDNILISYEIMHYMKRKSTGKTGWMALKLDMSKAYDRVEWTFLESMLLKMGLAEHLVNLFMECVKSARYQISHAGKEFGTIIPTRGIRQGNPLSSYLFLICMEGFSALIRDFERRNLVKGIQVARGAPSLTHMFFADDTYIFCKAKQEVTSQVVDMLHIFECASGQKINVDKSSAFFSRNMLQSEKVEICNTLRIEEAGDNATYLGLPNMLGRKKTSVFGYLKDRLRDRVQGWEKNFLSGGGKEVLLKTVAQSLPNYAMSIFLIPQQTCRELEGIMSRFWWKTSKNKDKGISWLSWDMMCRRKTMGGMGFRKLHEFNIALLGKQAWRFISNQDSLVSKLYRARYFPNGSFLSATLGNNPSYAWRSILEAQVLLKKGAVRRVGSGETINIEYDPWLPNKEDPYIHTTHEAVKNMTVSSLMITGAREWDYDLINDIFNDRDASLILSIPLNDTDVDKWFWSNEKMGLYTVRSAYGLLRSNGAPGISHDTSSTWKAMWNLKLPPKIKIFLWRALSGILPTKDQLRMRKVDVNVLCPVCNEEPESSLHSLVHCQIARACWKYARYDFNSQGCTSVLQWFKMALDAYKKDDLHLIGSICWSLWRNRNEIVWNQRGEEFVQIVESAKHIFNQWRYAQDKSFDISLGFITQADGSERWTKPNEGRLKINVDAACFTNSNKFSFAFITRDNYGGVIEAFSSCRQGQVEPEIAEAIGIREALSWAKEKKWRNVLVESDCLVVVQAIRCSNITLSYLGRVVEDCKDLLSQLKHHNAGLNFVKRSANKVAHELARHSSSIADRRWSGGDVHQLFSFILYDDLKV